MPSACPGLFRYRSPFHHSKKIVSSNSPHRLRDRLLRRGPDALTDAELVAIVLGVRRTGATGKPETSRTPGGHSAPAVEEQMLEASGGLVGLSTTDVRALTRCPGLGPARSARLACTFEIGRRVEAHQAAARACAGSPAQVAALFGPGMRGLHREEFRVVFLNTSHRITGSRVVSIGGIAASIVEPRAVFREAVLENAAAVICVHNHPSANPEPSREDVRVSRQLADAGRVMGIPLHDHIIIAGRRYTSLAERGVLS